MSIVSRSILKELILILTILVISLITVYFFLNYFFNINLFVIAAPDKVEYLGSEFQICPLLVSDVYQTGQHHLHPKFTWDFTSSQSDYADGEPPPTEFEAVLPASTQASVWIEVDDDPNFSSVDFNTGEIATTSESYTATSTNLSYAKVYFWRIKARDSYNSVSDWGYGASFVFNNPYELNVNTIRLRSGVKLKGGIKFK